MGKTEDLLGQSSSATSSSEMVTLEMSSVVVWNTDFPITQERGSVLRTPGQTRAESN